jgi:hypothetical protein
MREEKPCYLPEVGGYFMSKGEQREVYLGLKNRKKEIMNEIAAIDVNLKAAGVLFASLSMSLTECQAGNLDWSRYQKLTSGLPDMGRRYEALKLELANVDAKLDQFIAMD